MAVERIRRLKGSTYISPESPSSRSKLEVLLKTKDGDQPALRDVANESQSKQEPDPTAAQPDPAAPAPQRPASGSFKSFSVQMESITAPSALPLSAGIEFDENGKLSVKIEFSSPTTSTPSGTAKLSPTTVQSSNAAPITDMEVDPNDAVDEERGIATLLAMRRNKGGDSPAKLPAPLSQRALKLVPALEAAGSSTTRKYISPAYYRTERVLNTQSPRTAMTPNASVSGSLPRALHEINLRRDGAVAHTPRLVTATGASPRVFIPPPSLPSSRPPFGHARTTSDGLVSGRQSRFIIPPPSPSRRFIPPPPRTARLEPMSPARRFIIPPPGTPRHSLPRSPPRYLPYAELDELPSPSPHKESFLRQSQSRPETPVSTGQGENYKPCGSVETRRRRSGPEELDSDSVRPKAFGRSVSDTPLWPEARAASHSHGSSISRKRTCDESVDSTRFSSKRARSDSGSEDGSTGSRYGGSRPSSTRVLIPPPHVVPARRVMIAPRGQAGSSRRSTSPPEAKLAVEQQTSTTTADLLAALLEEVKGSSKENGGVEAAKALENVASTLAQVAQKLRKSK